MGVRLIDDVQFTIGKYGIRSIPSPDYETRVAIKKSMGQPEDTQEEFFYTRRYCWKILIWQNPTLFLM